MFTSVCISPLLFITKVHVRKLHCCFQNYLNLLNGCIAEKAVRQRNARLITTLMCLSSNLVLSYKYPFQSVKVFQGNPHEFNIALGKSFNFFVDQVGGPIRSGISLAFWLTVRIINDCFFLHLGLSGINPSAPKIRNCWIFVNKTWVSAKHISNQLKPDHVIEVESKHLMR